MLPAHRGLHVQIRPRFGIVGPSVQLCKGFAPWRRRRVLAGEATVGVRARDESLFILRGLGDDVVDKEGHGARVLEVDQDLGAVNVACETHHHLGIQGHKLHAEAYQRRVQLETKEAILAL